MAVLPSDIRFVFYLPNLGSYRDRVNLIGRVAAKVGRGVLVTSHADASAAELGVEDLEIIEVPPGRRYPMRTPFAASRTVGRLLESGDFNVVHDTFGHLIPLFWRRRRHPGKSFVTSLYSIAEWDLRRWVWPYHRLGTIMHPNLRLWLLRALVQRVIIRVADSVVVQAPGLGERLVEHVPGARSKVAWIPNNVVDPGWRVELHRPAGARQSIKLL